MSPFEFCEEPGWIEGGSYGFGWSIAKTEAITDKRKRIAIQPAGRTW
jgi:hypothetical protein